MNLNKLKLSTKLITGFAVILLLTVMVSILSIYRLNQIQQTLTSLVDKENKKLTLSYEMKGYINEIAINIRNIGVTNDTKYMEEQKKKIDEDTQKYKELETQLESLLYTDKGKEAYKEIKNNDQVAFDVFNNAVKTGMKVGVTNEELQIMLDALKKPEEDLLVSIDKMIIIQDDLAKAKSEESKAITQSSSKQMVFLTIFSVILGILATYFIRKSIINQVKELADGAKMLSEGNLNFSMDVDSNDEMGQAITALNTSIENLRTNITGVKEESSSILEGSEKTNKMFLEVSDRVQQVSAATEEISAGMEESSAAVEEVTSMANTVQEEINNTTIKAQEGLKVALDIQTKADKINKDSKNQKKMLKKFIKNQDIS